MKEIFETYVTVSPSENEFKNRWVRFNYKKKYLKELHNFDLAFAVQGKVRRQAVFQRYGKKTLDQDNLNGGLKPLIDALKEKRLIYDDSPKYFSYDVTQFPAKNRKPLTLVVMYEEA